MVVNIEDAGFEIRDVVSWIYGSGFPKSLNISKAIDKAAGVEFAAKPAEGVGFMNAEGKGGYNVTQNQLTRKGKSTEEAKQWDGWGTALKPACEFFTLCRKPLSEKTVAANVLKWGTGGINIDGCRVGTDIGRFPANLIHDGSQQVLELFPETNKDSAARFFYCPKASKKDRDEGNTHPTVKPTALMQYLCRLITPTGGVVLDPYMGSGSTGKAAVKEGFSFVGCELDEDYYKIATARIEGLTNVT
jgi:site-specific DNA-methyltransferase (adenine-specific)